MIVAIKPKMTLAEYLDYDDGSDTCYELVDGVLVEMGAEYPINSTIATFLLIYFAQLGISPYRLAIGHQIAVSSAKATARQPDLIVHTEESAAAILSGTRLLMVDMPVPALVVEVVSSSDTDKASRDRDYLEKRAEYAERGIPEYWIVDPIAGLVMVLHWVEGRYEERRFRDGEAIGSSTFPGFVLTAAQVLSAGR
jgi:Uma2 family endonuclease